jgi:hypothetical protein
LSRALRLVTSGTAATGRSLTAGETPSNVPATTNGPPEIVRADVCADAWPAPADAASDASPGADALPLRFAANATVAAGTVRISTATSARDAIAPLVVLFIFELLSALAFRECVGISDPGRRSGLRRSGVSCVDLIAPIAAVYCWIGTCSVKTSCPFW